MQRNTSTKEAMCTWDVQQLHIKLFISDKKASVLKREITKKSSQKMFEQDEGRVISEAAIRSGQSRYRQKNKLSEDPVQSIHFLKASNAFGAIILLNNNKHKPKSKMDRKNDEVTLIVV